MFKVFWSSRAEFGGPLKSGYSLAFATKAEAVACEKAQWKAGRNAKVVCAACGEDDPDFCSSLKSEGQSRGIWREHMR